MAGRGLEGGSPQRGGLELFLRGPGRLLYLCRSGCAQNGGGQAAGAGGGWGTPGMGREAWLPRYRVGSLRYPGRPGRATALGPCFRKSRLTPLHWAEE